MVSGSQDYEIIYNPLKNIVHFVGRKLIMIVSELINLLEDCPQDAEILTPTSLGTLTRAMRIGTIEVVPVVPGSIYDRRQQSTRLEPGNEWRVPLNSKDEASTEREIHIIII